MGIFLSKYSMLSALAYEDDQYILPEAQKLLNKFKLKALIIHDPKIHSDFHNKLRTLFDRLNYLTGNDFLFFCIIDPPVRPKPENKNNIFGAWEPDKLLSPKNAYFTNEESINAYSLAQSLGIEYNSLPVIILTKDFQSKTFRSIKTNADYLEFQLKEVGFFCSQQEIINNELNSSNFNSLIKTIDLCGGNEFGKLSKSLAVKLTDFLSFIISNTNSNESIKAKNQREKVFQSYYQLKENSSEIIDFERRNLEMLGHLANVSNSLFKPDNSQTPPYAAEDKDFNNYLKTDESISHSDFDIDCGYLEEDTLDLADIENESKIILKTYNKIAPYFSRILSQMNINENKDIDYSPLAISIGKIFEIEVNLSIVQWVRKYLNIEMPEFYNKYKTDSKEYKITPSINFTLNPRSVDFNKGHNNKWLPPGIGESELVLKTMFQQGVYPNIGNDDFEIFLKNWSIIRKYRNKSAHNNVLSFDDYHQMEKSFLDLQKGHKFKEMVKLKNSLKHSE